MPKTLVLMDHDGGVDDYLSTVLLLTMEHVEPLGIVVTPADCYIQPAVAATRKILDLLGRAEIPVAASTVRGLHPFPRALRVDSYSINAFPILNEAEKISAPLASETGQEFMARVLREATAPVTILVTGPLSTVAAALDLAPDIESKIQEILWMGGALDVNGNVSDSGHDGSAEWNVFWDPIAAYRVWQTKIPITLCPLDITNNVPVTRELLTRLARQRRFPISDFTGQCYALVAHQRYYFWDVLTTAYLAHPEFFTVRECLTEVIPHGESAGRTKISETGRRTCALATVDTEKFYDYILEAWA